MAMYKAESVRSKTQLAKLTGKCQLISEGGKKREKKQKNYVSQSLPHTTA